jgi:hypothetical protein
MECLAAILLIFLRVTLLIDFKMTWWLMSTLSSHLLLSYYSSLWTCEVLEPRDGRYRWYIGMVPDITMLINVLYRVSYREWWVYRNTYRNRGSVYRYTPTLWTAPCRGEGACVFQCNRALCRPELLLLVGPTKSKRSRWRFLTKLVLFIFSFFFCFISVPSFLCFISYNSFSTVLPSLFVAKWPLCVDATLSTISSSFLPQ